MRVSGLYFGLMVAAGLCAPVMAQEAFDWGRMGGDAEGGIQTGKTRSYVTTNSTAGQDKDAMQRLSDFMRNKNNNADIVTTAKTDNGFKSDLLKPNVTYATDGIEGIGTTPTKDTHGMTDPNFDPGLTGGISDGFEAPTGHSGDVLDSFGKKDVQKDTLNTNKDAENNLTEKQDAWKNKKEQEAAKKAKQDADKRKRAEECKKAENQQTAKEIAADDAEMRAQLEEVNLPASEQCIAASKSALESCAKGDVEGTLKAREKAEQDCQTKIAVDTPTPVGTVGAAPTLEGPVGMLDQVKEKLSGLLGLDAKGQANPFQQMMIGMLMQKVQEMMGGGGGGSDEDDFDYPIVTPPTPVCDKAISSETNTIVTYFDPKTGVKVDVSPTVVVSPTVAVSGSAVEDDKKPVDVKKLTKIETVITSDLCLNGNMRLKTVETTTKPDGTVDTKTSEDIIEDN